jgi:hypothetical protein
MSSAATRAAVTAALAPQHCARARFRAQAAGSGVSACAAPKGRTRGAQRGRNAARRLRTSSGSAARRGAAAAGARCARRERCRARAPESDTSGGARLDDKLEKLRQRCVRVALVALHPLLGGGGDVAAVALDDACE